MFTSTVYPHIFLCPSSAHSSKYSPIEAAGVIG